MWPVSRLLGEIDGRKVLPLQGQSVLDLFAGKTQTTYDGADKVGYELFGLKAYFAGDWKILWMPKPFGTERVGACST